MLNNAQILSRAWQAGVVVPAFNVPYLPMIEPVVKAVVDEDAFALIATARLEWFKFEAGGVKEVWQAFQPWDRPAYIRLHLDHVPVIDEDNQRVDYLPIIRQALELGYQSVMVDGSRLSLAENIAATRAAVDLAQAIGAACEAELGAVMGHEAGPLPPYEELFASGKGFTDIQECSRFVRETGCDWLSVAIGNIHGAVSGAARNAQKVQARLNLEHLAQLNRAAGVPLVLHGGSGIQPEHLRAAVKAGIAKVNVGTEIRQAYEQAWRPGGDVPAGQQAVYDRTVFLIREIFRINGTRRTLVEEE